MNDIDLIPASYRKQLWQRAWLRVNALFLAALVLASIAAVITISNRTNSVKRELDVLREQKSVVTEYQQKIDNLNRVRTEFLRNLSLLRGLRSGVEAQNLFATIDRALTGDDVWFLNWQFRRANVAADETTRTVNTGYFVVVPEGAAGPSPVQVQTRMSIHGQARDHSALSSFVQRLLAQDGIYDVSVLRTTQRQYSNITVTDFDLTVLVNDGAVTR